MTLDQWIEKYDGYVGNHSNGLRYIPGCHYLENQAYRELWTLCDYAVTTVTGGAVWLRMKGQ